ncbi:MAG: hypothetical protein LBH84_00830 [Prevotellaceae bacterium]|jgi:hypothetical protein|nr:hypothetical protein [Prevotellaceae bacterium]
MIRIFTCRSCSRIHLEIGNTQIHFNSPHHLQKYLENLDSVDAAYFAAINRAKGLEKVIILPLDNTGVVHLGFTLQEFENLKTTIRSYLSEEKRQKSPTTFRRVTLNVLEVRPEAGGCPNIYALKPLS